MVYVFCTTVNSFCTAKGLAEKEKLDAAHEEALAMMKEAEEMLAQGENDASREQFEAALGRCVPSICENVI